MIDFHFLIAQADYQDQTRYTEILENKTLIHTYYSFGQIGVEIFFFPYFLHDYMFLQYFATPPQKKQTFFYIPSTGNFFFNPPFPPQLFSSHPILPFCRVFFTPTLSTSF